MYALFVCMDCKIALWLGKAVFKNDKVNFFHIGRAQDPRNAQRPELNRVLWKMLADHAEHNIQVLIQGHGEYERIIEGEFTEIGDEISFENYLKDWPG